MQRNITKLNRLADRVEACPDVTIDDHEPNSGPAFTMARVQYECGAPGCIVGHNAAMHGRTSAALDTTATLADDLGITLWHADKLCAPERQDAQYDDYPGQPGYISAARAAAVLRNLAKIGYVNWTIPAADDSVEKVPTC